MRFPNSFYMYVTLLLVHANVVIVSCRLYPYRPIGVRRSQPGEVPFEDNGTAEPQFSPEHANAFHRRTIGARNQGLPTRSNPHTNGSVPPWGLPLPSRAEQAENQLRNSKAAKNPRLNLWVYNNVDNAFALYVVGTLVLFAVPFSLAIVGLSWLWDNDFLDLLPIIFYSSAFFSTGTIVFATMNAADGFYDYLVDHWCLGMERLKKAQVMEADERRWAGEMVVAQ